MSSIPPAGLPPRAVTQPPAVIFTLKLSYHEIQLRLRMESTSEGTDSRRGLCGEGRVQGQRWVDLMPADQPLAISQ